MSKTKYLDFYKRCMQEARLPENGLCNSFKKDPLFALIDPDQGESNSYWGFEDDYWTHEVETVWYEFTTLRQTVVLLMAAMNNEL